MEQVLRVVTYVALALLFYSAGLFMTWRAFRSLTKPLPKVIAPVQVLGNDGNDQGKGDALARMLLVRLDRIQEQIKATNVLLQTAREPPSDQRGVTDEHTERELVALPARVFEPLDLPLSVGGVELGGILSSLHKFFSEEGRLEFTVHYADDMVLVAGGADSPSGPRLWLQIDTQAFGDSGPSDRQIVEEIAYSLSRHLVSRRIEEVAALETGEFRMFLETLHEIAGLNREVIQGRITDRSEYLRLLPTLETLAEQMPNWTELQRVAAQTAENADELERAVRLYEQELGSHSDASPLRSELEVKIAEISKTLSDRLAQRREFSDDPLQGIRSLLAFPSFEMDRPVRVGILGGSPVEAILQGNDVLILGEDSGENVRYMGMTAYITDLGYLVQELAPRATLVFARTPVATSASLLDSFEQFIENNVDIILVALRLELLGGRSVWEPAINTAVKLGVLVVLSAGKENSEHVLENSDALHGALVVGSVTESGVPASFSRRGEDLVWLPGTDIPVATPDGQRRVSGTGLSAALAAATASWVIAAREEVSPKDAVTAIRVSAKGNGEPGTVPIPNLEYAIEEIKN